MENTSVEDQKSMLEQAQDINKDHKMISKSENDVKLAKAESEISEVIQKIDRRIEEIKSEGAGISDVKQQRDLYSEAMQLKHEKDRKSGLSDKLKSINTKRTELSDDQKEFFGISTEPDEPDPMADHK